MQALNKENKKKPKHWQWLSETLIRRLPEAILKAQAQAVIIF